MNRFFIKNSFSLTLLCQLIMSSGQAQDFKILYPRLLANALATDVALVPFNRDDTQDEYFTFVWSDSSLLFAPYRLEIVEIIDTQTRQQALDSNPPVYVKEGIDYFYYNYPWNAPELELGKRYAFSVTGFDGTRIIRPTSGFELVPLIISPFFLPRMPNQYVLLQEVLDGSFHIAYDKRLWIKYREDYEVSPSQNLRYAVYDSRRQVMVETDDSGIPNTGLVNTVPIRYGENYLVINLETCSGIEMLKYYYLEVWNEKGRRWYLRFIFDYSIIVPIVPILDY